MSDTQKDLTMLLMKYITKNNVIKGIVLFLQEESQQLKMIQYLVANNNLSEEQILEKMIKILDEEKNTNN